MANICLAGCLTLTKRIRVLWDEGMIETSRNEGQVRGLNYEECCRYLRLMLCTIHYSYPEAVCSAHVQS